ncbi:hypothetical protein PSPO01_14286 [Paraphaeosphaeria sporulosa]
MDQFLEAIGDTWHGVKYPINNIITCVVGKNPLAKKTGLIGVWNDSALQKLCDLDYHKYNIKDYLLDIMKATSKLSQSPSELPTSSESLGRGSFAQLNPDGVVEESDNNVPRLVRLWNKVPSRKEGDEDFVPLVLKVTPIALQRHEACLRRVFTDPPPAQYLPPTHYASANSAPNTLHLQYSTLKPSASNQPLATPSYLDVQTGPFYPADHPPTTPEPPTPTKQGPSRYASIQMQGAYRI